MFTVGELTGASFLVVVREEEHAEIADRVRRRVAGEQLPTGYELNLVRKDGTPFVVEVRAGVVTYQGAPAELVLLRDISERKQADEKLRLSEDKFAKAFHGTPDAMLISRLSDGCVVEVNEGFVRMSGSTREEVLGSSTIALDLWATPGDRERYVAALRQDGSVRGFDSVIRVKSGDIRQCLVAGALIEIEGEAHILSLVQDVTEQRRAAAAVKASEALLRGILDNLQDAYVRTDRDGRFILVSPSTARMYGYDSVEEMIGLPASSLYADQAEREAMFAELRRLGAVSDYVGRGVRKDGSTFSVSLNAQSYRDDQGNVLGSEGVVRDITERRQAQEALRESEEKHRILLDESPDPMFSFTPEGRYRYVNRAFAEGVGKTVEGVIGKSIWDVFPKDEADQRFASLSQVFRTGAEEVIEVRVPLADGDRYYVTTITPIKDAAGEVCSAICASRDITARKRAEDEIRRLNAELEERVVTRTAQRDAFNRELETFAYSAAHDLRAPLRAIDGFSKILVEDAAERLTPDELRYLERVRAAAQRMARMIDDLMGLSKVSRRPLLRGTVDVSATAHEVAEELRVAQPERRVELVIAPGMTAEADLALLRLVLVQLLDNAWKFTSKHDQARIEVGVTEAGRSGDGAGGKERAFFVRDDGAGFNMSYAKQLFGAFQRFHAARDFEGDGIGLATVQRLVLRHGGRVWAEAEVEKGATFFFTLPLAEAASV